MLTMALYNAIVAERGFGHPPPRDIARYIYGRLRGPCCYFVIDVFCPTSKGILVWTDAITGFHVMVSIEGIQTSRITIHLANAAPAAQYLLQRLLEYRPAIIYSGLKVLFKRSPWGSIIRINMRCGGILCTVSPRPGEINPSFVSSESTAATHI